MTELFQTPLAFPQALTERYRPRSWTRRWTKADHALWTTLYSADISEAERESRWANHTRKRDAAEQRTAFRRVARKHGQRAAILASCWANPAFGPVDAADLYRIRTEASYAAHHAFAAHPELREAA